MTTKDKMAIKEIYNNGNDFVKCGTSILLNNLTDYELTLEKVSLEKSPIRNILINSGN